MAGGKQRKRNFGKPVRKILRSPLTVGMVAFLHLPVFAQNSPISADSTYIQEKCASWHVLSEPQRRQLEILEAQIEPLVQRYLQRFQNPALRNELKVIEIPVVFNVVYDGPSPPVSVAQIYAQLDTLNQYFRFRNRPYANLPPYFESVAADTRIEFCLATRDPSGNPTSGIRYRQTGVGCFWAGTWDERSTANGGLDPWDPNRYLNIWIVDLCWGVLGIATFPGAGSPPPGVTVDFITLPGGVAPFDQGKTAIHEIGHFFGLRHIWGDANCGDDKVEDTPPADGSTSGCPTFPQPVTCAGKTWQSKMFVNHMDYSDDACLHVFTQGQAARMWAFLQSIPDRRNLSRSSACSNAANDLGVKEILYPRWAVCSTTFSPRIVLKNYGTNTVSSATIRVAIDGTIVQTTSWSGSLAPEDTTAPLTLSPVSASPGTVHMLCIWTENPNGTADGYPANDTFCLEFSTPYPCGFTSDFENGPGGVKDSLPGPVWHIINPDLETAYNEVGQDGFPYTWTRSIPQEVIGSTGSPTYTAYMEFYRYSTQGARDYMISPAIDLTGASVGSAITLQFDYAYRQYSSAYQDSLIVEVSTDCGQTWTRVWAAGGNSLATAGATTNEFFPTQSTEWATATVNLSAYAGQTIMLRFQSYNGFGNNLFVDNISVSASSCAVFPLTPSARLNARLLRKTSSMANVEVQWQVDAPLEPLQEIRLLRFFPGQAGGILVASSLPIPEGSIRDSFPLPVAPSSPENENMENMVIYRLEGRLPDKGSHWQLLATAVVYLSDFPDYTSADGLPEPHLTWKYLASGREGILHFPGGTNEFHVSANDARIVLYTSDGKQVFVAPLYPTQPDGREWRFFLPASVLQTSSMLYLRIQMSEWSGTFSVQGTF